MSAKKYHRRWLQKYIRAIHRHDQCLAMADDMEERADPKLQSVRKLQQMYDFLSKIAEERMAYYKHIQK